MATKVTCEATDTKVRYAVFARTFDRLLNCYQLFEYFFFAQQLLKCVYSTVDRVNFAFDAV